MLVLVSLILQVKIWIYFKLQMGFARWLYHYNTTHKYTSHIHNTHITQNNTTKNKQAKQIKTNQLTNSEGNIISNE
jgi:hypothetical protein